MDRRVAIISPVALLEKYSTDFHLVLTQYYLKSHQYRDFCLRRSAMGDFIVLDNGAAELKAAVEGLDMMDVVEELLPDIVVAPDIIYDRDRTIDRTEAFLKEYKYGLGILGVMVMAVPQGADSEEWYECYTLFNADSRVDWLGISMFYTPKFNKRLEVLERIAPTVRKPCHLLGLWDNPYDLLEERKFDFVHSVDTAKPLEYAIEGLALADWSGHRHIDNDWYFNVSAKSLGTRSSKVLELAAKNMKDFVRLFKDGKIE